MKPTLKSLGMAALAGALAIAMTTPGQARHKRHVRAVVVATTVVPGPQSFTGANPGSYYNWDVNPRFGYVPELGYSNAVMFRIYPRSD